MKKRTEKIERPELKHWDKKHTRNPISPAGIILLERWLKKLFGYYSKSGKGKNKGSGNLPPPSKTPIEVRGYDLYLYGEKKMLVCAGDYFTLSDTVNFPGTAELDWLLNTLTAYGVNTHRCFLTNAELGPYRKTGETDYFLTATRAQELDHLDQWDENYWNRLRHLAAGAKSRSMILILAVWDHWQMYQSGSGHWARHPYNPRNHYQCGMPGVSWQTCEDFIPDSDLAETLLFPAWYRNLPGRRAIMAELLAKIHATVGDLGNIIWEPMNEPRDGDPGDILAWHKWVIERLHELNASVVTTATPAEDLQDDIFLRHWIDLTSFHGLGPGAGGDARNVQPLTARYGKPAILSTDGLHAGAQPGGRRNHPDFIRALFESARRINGHCEFKLKITPADWDQAALEAIRAG